MIIMKRYAKENTVTKSATYYVLVPCRVKKPGLQPRTRITRDDIWVTFGIILVMFAGELTKPNCPRVNRTQASFNASQ